MFILRLCQYFSFFFFFNDTATTEIYTLSLHDALPISPISYPSPSLQPQEWRAAPPAPQPGRSSHRTSLDAHRSEEHTSELQSQSNLVCRLLLEKKKNSNTSVVHHAYLSTA